MQVGKWLLFYILILKHARQAKATTRLNRKFMELLFAANLSPKTMNTVSKFFHQSNHEQNKHILYPVLHQNQERMV